MTVTLERTYARAEEAERIARALEADRPAFLGTDRDGATLRFTLRASSATSARATLEDLLPCLAAAERTAGVVPPSAARPGR